MGVETKFYIKHCSNNQGQIRCATGSSPSITNCIIGDTETAGEGREHMIYVDESSPKVSYSNIWTQTQEGYPGIGNTDEDPLFVNYNIINEDFARLKYGSPCIDKGIQIDDLYSDIRGSLRPLGGIGVSIEH